MFKKVTPWIAILIAMFIAGCGSSGKSTIIPPVPPLQPLLTSKSLPANTLGTIVTGNVTVDIPTTAFAQTSIVTVTGEQIFEKPPNARFQSVGDRAGLTISSSSAPRDQIRVTISGLTRSNLDVGKSFYGLVYKTADGWKSATGFVEMVGDKVEVAVDKTAFTFMNGIAVFKGLIGKITIVSPIESKGLVEINGDPGVYYQKRVCIIVPGFNNTVSSLALLSDKLKAQHYYRKIFGFSYDYRSATSVSAKSLGESLDLLASQGYEMDLLGHSRGGLICRMTLENYSKTRNVLNFYSVCTPHEGVSVAIVSQLMDYLRNDYLNSTDDTDQPFGILAFDTEATSELFPNCKFLKDLNDPTRILFRGNVNYHIVGSKNFSGASGDYLAGGDTGQAKNVPFEQITAGAVNRYYLPNNSHTSLVKTTPGINELIGAVFNRTKGSLALSVEPNDVYFDFSNNCWNFDLKFVNNSASTLKFIDMAFDVYDKDGIWSSGCWYNPTTQYPDHFPKDYTAWGETISPGGVRYIQLESKTDYYETPYDQIPLADKASTLKFVVRYQDTATLRYYSERVISRHLGPGIFPTEPVWRSLTRGTVRNTHILFPRK